MGIFQKLSKGLGLSRDINIEEYMDAIDMENVDLLHEEADFYVKPVALESEADTKIVEDELKLGNIILLNVSPMLRSATHLKQAISNLRTFVYGMNGDIARIDEDKILLTPARVKIVKKKGQKGE
jgi:SepF-like predicted cell division protein (DUF552 family)